MGFRKRILIAFLDDATADLLERSVIKASGHQVVRINNYNKIESLVVSARPDLMILGDGIEGGDHLALATRLLEKQPTLPIILFTTKERGNTLPREVIHLGLVDWLSAPLNIDAVRAALKRGLERSQHWQDWLQAEANRYTRPLLQRVDELEALAKVGRSVTAQLDLDAVLTSVVDAAVELTYADEGSILLLDEKTDELYMRAARNFQEEFVSTFRLAAEDTLAGEVIRTGEPVFMAGQAPKKIKTAYLVYSLIYVPLVVQGKTIGVLGVDNRETNKSFDQRQITLMSALADYASVAIENANLYAETNRQRNKLEKILTQIQDGVVVVDANQQLVLVNHTVRKAFDLGPADLTGQGLTEVFAETRLVEAIQGKARNPERIEIKADNGRIYSLQVTIIPDIGTVATLHDISYLKELDSLKTDFVNTVSHDLRSPLTSILGYVELIERVGEVNEKQSEFIGRVKMSVDNITELISNLLNLGRVEVNRDEDIENTPLAPIINYSMDGLRTQLEARQQELIFDVPEKLATLNANPLQLRQVMDNLIGNAIKYTPIGGKIMISAYIENGQVIIRVKDNGPGIPPNEHSKIFEKFYRAKNIEAGTPGTGLGLAITKSIVDNHRGRIWVDSTIGEGSSFIVVLPIAEK